MRWIVFAIAVLPAPAVMAPSAATPLEKLAIAETKKLEGTWQVLSSVSDGEEVGREEVEKERLIFTGNKFRIEIEGEVDSQGTFAIVGQGPKWIEQDLTAEDEPTTHAIYQWIDADTLRWCVSTEEGKRPTQFSAAKGTKQVLIVYKRVPTRKRAGEKP